MQTAFFIEHTTPSPRLSIADIVVLDKSKSMFLLSRINVPVEYRGKGFGRELLSQVCKAADATDSHLYLEISPYGEMTAEQLIAWFHRNGFRRVPKEDHLMHRIPRGLL